MKQLINEILRFQKLAGLNSHDFKKNLISILTEAERTKSGVKVKSAYLTKNKSAMKREIDRVKKLKSDDTSAYEKWDADYSDKDKTKKYKTKKSAATTAYEKRFGNKK